MPSGNIIQIRYQLHRVGITTQFCYQLSLVLNIYILSLWCYNTAFYQLMGLVIDYPGNTTVIISTGLSNIWPLELPRTWYQQDIMLPLSPYPCPRTLLLHNITWSVVSDTAWYQQCIHIIWVVSLVAVPRKTALPLPNGYWAYLYTSSQPRTKRHH